MNKTDSNITFNKTSPKIIKLANQIISACNIIIISDDYSHLPANELFTQLSMIRPNVDIYTRINSRLHIPKKKHENYLTIIISSNQTNTAIHAILSNNDLIDYVLLTNQQTNDLFPKSLNTLQTMTIIHESNPLRESHLTLYLLIDLIINQIKIAKRKLPF